MRRVRFRAEEAEAAAAASEAAAARLQQSSTSAAEVSSSRVRAASLQKKAADARALAWAPPSLHRRAIAARALARPRAAPPPPSIGVGADKMPDYDYEYAPAAVAPEAATASAPAPAPAPAQASSKVGGKLPPVQDGRAGAFLRDWCLICMKQVVVDARAEHIKRDGEHQVPPPKPPKQPSQHPLPTPPNTPTSTPPAHTIQAFLSKPLRSIPAPAFRWALLVCDPASARVALSQARMVGRGDFVQRCVLGARAFYEMQVSRGNTPLVGVRPPGALQPLPPARSPAPRLVSPSPAVAL